MNEEGIICSTDWLLSGIGNIPTFINTNTTYIDDISNDLNTEQAIIQELNLFKNLHKNAIALTVQDDLASPIYEFGDYIGGIEVKKEKYHLLNNTFCIVHCENKYLIKRVNFEEQANNIQIFSINSKFDTMENLSPISIYEIIWHRKRSKTS